MSVLDYIKGALQPLAYNVAWMALGLWAAMLVMMSTVGVEVDVLKLLLFAVILSTVALCAQYLGGFVVGLFSSKLFIDHSPARSMLEQFVNDALEERLRERELALRKEAEKVGQEMLALLQSADSIGTHAADWYGGHIYGEFNVTDPVDVDDFAEGLLEAAVRNIEDGVGYGVVTGRQIRAIDNNIRAGFRRFKTDMGLK